MTADQAMYRAKSIVYKLDSKISNHRGPSKDSSHLRKLYQAD